MFYIVESDQQLDILKSYSEKGAYIKVISSNDNYHPLLTKTIAVYLRPLDHEEGYIIPINHDEGLNVDKDRLYDILKQYKILYTIDKKELLYHFILRDVIDLSLVYSMTNYERLELGKNNLTYNWFYNRLHDFKEVNALIPISKLYEKCEEDYKAIEYILHIAIPNGFDFYSKTATSVFFAIEHTGLRTIYQPYLDLFKPNNPVFNMEDNIAYTSYNLYNTTSRPTNAFNSVNYAAIPKAQEFRKAIIPQNDCFVEFDFDGYHLRLLCQQIGYELTNESAHMQLAKLYFGKDEIAEEDYAKAKQINFHAIYGKIPPEYAFLPIFERIQNYINRLWQHFQEKGYVEDPISGKRFTNDLKDMHPQKLMNYMMQSLETSRNILILKDLVMYLQDKKTKIALYTYDAIVFDFDKKEGKEVLEGIEAIMNQEGNYPVKFKHSNNLVL
jgi:hypothetical protein